MNAPKVSVILPLSERPVNLQRAVSSVLRQNMADLELLVVDAGNDAGIRSVVESCAAGDPRVRYLRSHGGASQACATGLQAARAPWVALQRDGDEWLLDRLVRQLDCAAKHGEDCQMIAGRLLQYMPVARTRMRDWRMPTGGGRLTLNEDTADVAALLQSAMIRRAALEGVGAFDPQAHAAQDSEWCRQLLGRGAAVAAHACVTVTYVSSGIELPNPTLEWLRKAVKR